jgi:hypothetical protein
MKKFKTKDSSLNRNGVFNNGEWTFKRCCLFGRVSTKMSKFKLRQVYATKHTSRNSGASDCLDSDLHPKSQKLL